jgi:hypothetical protein
VLVMGVWIVLLICVGQSCSDQVYAEPVDSILVCQLVAGDISRIYEGSSNPRCVIGRRPHLPFISFTAADRYG